MSAVRILDTLTPAIVPDLSHRDPMASSIYEVAGCMLSGHITMQKTTLLLMLLSWPAHADTHCTPSRLLIVLDKSSSMNDSVDATGDSKWKMAKQAITEVATQYENKIDLGL